MYEFDEFQNKILKNINKGEDKMGKEISFDDDFDFGTTSKANTSKTESSIAIVQEEEEEIKIEDDFPKSTIQNEKTIKEIKIEDDFPTSSENIENLSKEKKETIQKKSPSSEKVSFSAEDFEKFKKDISENIDGVKKEIKQEVGSLVEDFSKTLLELQESIKIISNVSKPISELNVLIETQFEKMKDNNQQTEEKIFKKLNHISQSIEQEVQKNEKYIEEHEAFFKSTNYNGLRSEITKNEESSNVFIENDNDGDFEDMGIKNKKQESNTNKKINQKPLGIFGKFLSKIGV